MEFFSKFLSLADALEGEGVEYILVGGYAVILHGYPRMTQDIDLFLKPETSNVTRLRKALHAVFDDESIDEITLEVLNEFPVVRYGTPDDFYVDIIVRIGDAFVYGDLEYEAREVEGHLVRIATADTLYKMKKDTVRPVDKADALFLRDLIEKKHGKS